MFSSILNSLQAYLSVLQTEPRSFPWETSTARMQQRRQGTSYTLWIDNFSSVRPTCSTSPIFNVISPSACSLLLKQLIPCHTRSQNCGSYYSNLCISAGRRGERTRSDDRVLLLTFPWNDDTSISSFKQIPEAIRSSRSERPMIGYTFYM